MHMPELSQSPSCITFPLCVHVLEPNRVSHVKPYCATHRAHLCMHAWSRPPSQTGRHFVSAIDLPLPPPLLPPFLLRRRRLDWPLTNHFPSTPHVHVRPRGRVHGTLMPAPTNDLVDCRQHWLAGKGKPGVTVVVSTHSPPSHVHLRATVPLGSLQLRKEVPSPTYLCLRCE